ncbi:hypothetical protein MTO96_004254 [Rhipicephalus appendiculatus]
MRRAIVRRSEERGEAVDADASGAAAAGRTLGIRGGSSGSGSSPCLMGSSRDQATSPRVTAILSSFCTSLHTDDRGCYNPAACAGGEEHNCR